MTMRATKIIIRDSDVSITLAVDEDTVRRLMAPQIAELRGLIMSQSAEIHNVAGLVDTFTTDMVTRVKALEAAIADPNDETQLSSKARAELTGIVAILDAARAAANLPAETEPAPETTETDGSGEPAVSEDAETEAASGADVEADNESTVTGE